MMTGVVVLQTVGIVPLGVTGVGGVSGVLVERVLGRAVDRVFRGLVVVRANRGSSPWSRQCPAATGPDTNCRALHYTPPGYGSIGRQVHAVIPSSGLP